MLAGISIQEQDGLNRRLCFYGDAKGAIEEIFHRQVCLVKSTLREYKNGNTFFDDRFQYPYTACTVLSTAPVYRYHRIPVNIAEEGDLGHFYLAQYPHPLAKGFNNNGRIQV